MKQPSESEAQLYAEIEKAAVFGIAPVLGRERIYGFLAAFLVLSGYCIATWGYTQGAYLATLVGGMAEIPRLPFSARAYYIMA